MGLALSSIVPGTSFGRQSEPPNNAVHIFSKHLQWLNFRDMAQAAAGIGFDGVDLTVRPKGHVLPENVEKDLPSAVRAIRAAGLTADRITTAIVDPDDPGTETILATASQMGIRSYRLGWLKYRNNGTSLPAQLAEHQARLKGLAAMNEHYQIQGNYQNHSGKGVGSPVWDLWQLLKDLDPAWMGVRYDIRHATVEGMNSWELGLQLLAPFIHTLDMKDFRWVEKNGDWGIESVPIGTGAVDFPRFFELLDLYNLGTSSTLHMEYPLGGADKGAPEISVPPETVFNAMRRDLGYLRSHMKTS